MPENLDLYDENRKLIGTHVRRVSNKEGTFYRADDIWKQLSISSGRFKEYREISMECASLE